MISIVIPSYNSETTIEDCLRSILDQDIQELYEVVVVDSSVDRTPKIVREKFPLIKFIHLKSRTDAGTARTIGVQNTTGELISFIDSDCTIDKSYLRRILINHSLGTYAGVGGPVKNGNPQSVISWASYVIEFSEFLPSCKNKKEVSHIPSCNICYRREILNRYGGFPSKEVLQQEDLLLNWRMHSHGEKILFDPAVMVLHHHRVKLRSYLHHQYEIGIGTVQVLRKTNLRGSWLVARPALLAFVMPVIPFIKLIRSSFRFLKWDHLYWIKHPLVFPLLLLGLTSWLSGFTKEVYAKKGSEKNRAVLIPL